MDVMKHFRMPGFSSSAPVAPAPLPPLPEREDPAVLEAREKLRLSEKRRKGRRASILTSGSGLDDELGIVQRPSAGRLYAGDRSAGGTLGV
jgi:hypothetical protein